MDRYGCKENMERTKRAAGKTAALLVFGAILEMTLGYKVGRKVA
jgi:hypothetical protein